MKISFLSAVSFLFLFTACKKDRDAADSISAKKNLEVRLDTGYLKAGRIDSALLIWEVAGATEQYLFPLESDTLRLPLDSLREGRGTITIQLYSRVNRQGRNLQFEKRWQQTVSHREALTLAGPHGYDDPAWFPRVILSEASTSIVLIMGLRPADPYFSLRNLPARWPLIELERGYYETPGGVRSAGYKLWEFENTGQSFIEDRSYFASLGPQVGNKPWTWVYIGVGLFSKTDVTSFAASYGTPR